MTIARRIRVALLPLALLAALPAAAEKAPRRLLVSVAAKGGDAYTGAEVLQLSRSLMAAIAASGADILLVDWGPDPFPAEDFDKVSDEVKTTADCLLLVTVGGARKSPTLAVKTLDPLLKTDPVTQRVQLEAAFDLPDPPASTWTKVVELVKATFAPLDTGAPIRTVAAAERPAMWTKDLSVLTLHAAPGTVVKGLDGEPRTIGEDGVLRESVRSPATYVLSATHPGHLPFQQTIYLDDDRELTLDQLPLARWSVDAGLYGMAFPQVEGSFFLVPGWLYARAGLMSYLGGLAFSSDQVFWSEPLTTLYVRVGTYAFFSPESPLRTYAGLGAFLRVAHPLAGTPAVYLDQAAGWGLQLTLGLEASPWARSRFFLEWLPTEYVTMFPDLLAASMGYVPDSMVFFPFGVLDLGGFRLGWRWML